MKFFVKSLAALALLVSAQSAMAATNVYLTGSTAFRSQVMTFLAGTAVFDTAPTEAYAGASATGATYANFTGTVGGNPVVVKCSWTGSTSGDFTIAHNGDGGSAPTALFFADGTTGTGLANPVAGTTGENHTADIGFSDVFQSSGPAAKFLAPAITTEHTVAVVAFKWIGNYSLAQNAAGGTPITNITHQGVNAIFNATYLASAQVLTGSNNAADKSIFIFAEGRDFDSGTRATALLDASVPSNTTNRNWQPFCDDGAGGGSNAYVGTPAASDGVSTADTRVVKFRQWNASTDSGVSRAYNLFGFTNFVTIGNGGFNSGGNLTKFMRLDTNNQIPAFYNSTLKARTGYSSNCTGAYCITYTGLADAPNALNPKVAVTLASVSISASSPTLTCTSTAGLARGMTITGTNIPANTTILSVNSATQITLSQSATGSASGTYATGALNQGSGQGVELSYDGVYFSPTAVQNGGYSMWGFEHILYNALGTDAQNVANNLESAMNNPANDLSAVGFHVSQMQVTRGTDGASITGTYY